MRLLEIRQRANLQQRRGFTLIELLTVVAIISVLVGLSISAIVATITYQHQKNTTFTMTQLNDALIKHWTAVAQTAQKENWNTPANGTALPLIRSWANGDDKRARVMYVKFRQKQEFPNTFDEALNPYPLPPKPAYVTYLKNLGITGSSAATAPYESSACLYMALSLATSGTKFNADQFGGAVHEFPAPNGTVKAFVDDWGNPLVFCRWPTGDPTLPSLCPIPSQLPTLIFIRDKDDWDGRLIDTSWQTANPTGVTSFQTNGHLITQSGQPYAYYLIPVIVSAGRDGNLGINQSDYGTLTVSNPGFASDNIYSYNLNTK